MTLFLFLLFIYAPPILIFQNAKRNWGVHEDRHGVYVCVGREREREREKKSLTHGRFLWMFEERHSNLKLFLDIIAYTHPSNIFAYTSPGALVTSNQELYFIVISQQSGCVQ